MIDLCVYFGFDDLDMCYVFFLKKIRIMLKYKLYIFSNIKIIFMVLTTKDIIIHKCCYMTDIICICMTI